LGTEHHNFDSPYCHYLKERINMTKKEKEELKMIRTVIL
jgi:DNA-binding CsgD family transcriptional regulator